LSDVGDVTHYLSVFRISLNSLRKFKLDFSVNVNGTLNNFEIINMLLALCMAVYNFALKL